MAGYVGADDADGGSLRLVFLGPPGAGKGTHAARCAAAWHIAHISTGDLFREEARRATPLGKQLASYMQQGALVPDALVLELVLARLHSPDARAGFILDGFPRTVAQAETLDRALAARQLPVELAIHFETSQSVVSRRLSGRRICRACGANYNIHTLRPRLEGRCDCCGGELYQRSDDLPETVLKRLDVYRTESAPVLEHYRRRGLLREVNGDVELQELSQMLTRLVHDEQLLRSAP